MNGRAVFLSAGIPVERPGRVINPVYKITADVIAIREATRAVAAIALKSGELVFGGHPAITPLIRQVGEALGAVNRITIFQSAFFRKLYPADVDQLTNVVETPAAADEVASLRDMRNRMLRFRSYLMGIFVGGMEGVEAEWDMFHKLQPNVPAFPIPTTGAAAQRLFDARAARFDVGLRQELQTSHAYASLIRRLVTESA